MRLYVLIVLLLSSCTSGDSGSNSIVIEGPSSCSPQMNEWAYYADNARMNMPDNGLYIVAHMSSHEATIICDVPPLTPSGLTPQVFSYLVGCNSLCKTGTGSFASALQGAAIGYCGLMYGTNCWEQAYNIQISIFADMRNGLSDYQAYLNALVKYPQCDGYLRIKP